MEQDRRERIVCHSQSVCESTPMTIICAARIGIDSASSPK
jgi:hypothetical protein